MSTKLNLFNYRGVPVVSLTGGVANCNIIIMEAFALIGLGACLLSKCRK